jgi:hypothetical protein
LFSKEMHYTTETFYVEISEDQEVRLAVVAPSNAGDWTVDMWRVSTGPSPTPSPSPSPLPTHVSNPGTIDHVRMSGTGAATQTQVITFQPGKWLVTVTNRSETSQPFRAVVRTSNDTKDLFIQEMTSWSQTFYLEITDDHAVELTVIPPSLARDWTIEMWHVGALSSPTPQPSPSPLPADMAERTPTPEPASTPRPSSTMTSPPSGASIAFIGLGKDRQSRVVDLEPGTWNVSISDNSRNAPTIMVYAVKPNTDQPKRVLVFVRLLQATQTFPVDIPVGDPLFNNEVEIVVVVSKEAERWSVTISPVN